MSRRTLSRTGTFKAYPAPGFLRTLQAFVNTRDVEAETDELTSPDALSEWLVDQGLVEFGTVLDEAAWENALEVREALRSQFRLHNGAKLEENPMKRLSRAFGEMRARFALKGDGSMLFEATEPAGWPSVRARLLIAVSDAMRQRQWRRLKACHSETCQWVFYDNSKNRQGKWCTARRCGNWINSATYRRRKPVWKRR